MKILKIFGVVVGIHVAALLLIFASPGCSSTNKAAPSPADTVVKTDDAPAPVTSSPSVSAPMAAPAGEVSPVVSVPNTIDPNSVAGPVVRFSPTRPGTPAAAALEAQPVADVVPASTYTAGKGDSLWTIAKKNHITVSELASANNIKAGATVRLGQKLIIPGKSGGVGPKATVEAPVKTPPPPAATTPARASGETAKHVVKSGETLGAIAHKYGVKVGDVATANNITDPKKIRPGMELTIPGASGPKAPKNTSQPKATAPDPSPVESVPAGDLDSGVKASEPPVIKIEDPNAPTKV